MPPPTPPTPQSSRLTRDIIAIDAQSGEPVTGHPGLLDLRGAHWNALEEINLINEKEGNASHTTKRMRSELLFHLLDNRFGGAIVEVGTMNGGVTALFAYIGKMTGRKCVAIDINPVQLEVTRKTCARHSLDGGVDFVEGTLAGYATSGAAEQRADLIFIDSSHRYDTTMEELRAIHDNGLAPRAIAFHDFSYRIGGYLPGASQNPIAVDYAVRDFYGREYDGKPPVMKRIGALTGDGMQASPDNPGDEQHDYVDWYGSEGMLILYP